MGVSHSMNKAQVDSVLDQFEATTDAIRGIEKKADRVSTIVAETQEQQEALHRQADRANLFVNDLTDSLNRRSEQVTHLRKALENIADVVELLEITIYDLGLKDLPAQVQRELGPLLMPALVLTLIVTVSNCCFGFLLATDSELAASILDAGTMNVLNIFAIFHVVLIGVAFLYLLSEGVLMCVKSHRQQKREAAGREGPEGLQYEEPQGLQHEEQEQPDRRRDSRMLSHVFEEEPPLAMTMRRSNSDPVISMRSASSSLSAGQGRAFCLQTLRQGPQSQSSQEEASMKPCASDYSQSAKSIQGQSSLKSLGMGTQSSILSPHTSPRPSPRPSLEVRSTRPSLEAKSTGIGTKGRTAASPRNSHHSLEVKSTGTGSTVRSHNKHATGAAHKGGAVSQMLRTALQSAQGGTSSMTSSTGAAGFRAAIASPFAAMKKDATESTEQMAQAREAGSDRDKKLLSTPGEGEGRGSADGKVDPSGSSSASHCRDGSSPPSQAYRRCGSTISV